MVHSFRYDFQLTGGFRCAIVPDMGTTYSWSAFARAWNRAGSANELARALRCAPTLVRSRACYLRKAGFKLKRFPPGRKVAR